MNYLKNKITLFLLLVWCASSVCAQEAAFDVMEYRVEGTTLLPAVEVERAVYPHLGEKKTLADVERARESLEKAYHDAGYLTVIVNIPQQKVDGGLVKLSVTEAPVDRLRVVQSRYFSLGEIKAGVPELAEGNVPNFSQMQEELAALSRSGDRRITPVLRPGKTPGTVEVDLKVQDTLPVHGSVELSDYRSEGSSPTHLTANLRFDNLWQSQHSLGLTLQNTPEKPDESRVFSANYTAPLRSGDFLSFYGVNTDSSVSAIGDLTVVGKGRIYGARYIVSLPGDAAFFQTASFGVDYKDFDQTLKFTSVDGFNTPISYMPFTMGWDGSWRGDEQLTRMGVSVNFHLPGFVGTDQQFDDKRYEGRSGYAYLRGNVSHSTGLGGGWGILGRSTLQIANQALISNEQFNLGGEDTVRGYWDGAAAGETGLAATVELSSPSFAKTLGAKVDDAHAIAFVDAGTVYVIDALTAVSTYHLLSAGVGLRMSAWRGLSFDVDWAVALEELNTTQRGDSRVNMKLGYQW